MAPATVEENFNFLISVIRWTPYGAKTDFEAVRLECNICSKGAAAKRYERLMKAHGIHPSQIDGGSYPTKIESGVYPRSKPQPAVKASRKATEASKKRKRDQFAEYNNANTDDDEGLDAVKDEADSGHIKAERNVKRVKVEPTKPAVSVKDEPIKSTASVKIEPTKPADPIKVEATRPASPVKIEPTKPAAPIKIEPVKPAIPIRIAGTNPVQFTTAEDLKDLASWKDFLNYGAAARHPCTVDRPNASYEELPSPVKPPKSIEIPAAVESIVIAD